MAKYCKHCGKEISDNAAFCRHCGEKVGFGEVTKKVPVAARPAVEETKEVLSETMKVIITIAVILVAAVAIIFFTRSNDVPDGDTGVHDDGVIFDEEGSETDISVAPIYADASSQHDDMGDISYPPENAIDGDLSTAWVEGVDGEGNGEWISVTFDNTEPIESLRIRNGYQKSEEAYKTNNRVKDVLVEFEDGSMERFTLMDRNNTEQVVVLSEEKSGSTIKLYIQSAYLSHDDNDTCITEIGAIGRGMDYPEEAEMIYAESY